MILIQCPWLQTNTFSWCLKENERIEAKDFAYFKGISLEQFCFIHIWELDLNKPWPTCILHGGDMSLELKLANASCKLNVGLYNNSKTQRTVNVLYLILPYSEI